MDDNELVAHVAHTANLWTEESRRAIAAIGRVVAEDFRIMAQTTHNAYHGEQGGTWRECTMASCKRAQDALAALGVTA